MDEWVDDEDGPPLPVVEAADGKGVDRPLFRSLGFSPAPLLG